MANCGVVIPIEVTFTIDGEAALGAGWDKIKVQRSTVGSSGPWQEVTKPTTRLGIAATQNEYVFTDTAGNPNYWYRSVLFNSTTQVDDTPSVAQKGDDDPALDIISIDELKTYYLFGLDLTDDEGNEYPDSLYAHYIKQAVDSLETKLQISVRRTVFEDEHHDFFREDYDKYIWVELHHFPVISIENVELVLPGEQVVQVFDKSWIHIQRHSGQLQLVPGTGTAGSILLGASGAWIPLIYGNNRFIPDAFRISYTAGFGKPPQGSYGFTPGTNPPSVSRPDPTLDRIPTLIKETVGKMASFGPLNIAGDLLGGAGIASQSIGIDGLSQSFNTTSSATSSGYGSRLIQYSKELKENYKELRNRYNGVRMVVV